MSDGAPVRIFISSPSDVRQERHKAEQIIAVLAREFAEVLRIEPVMWEWEPLTAGEHFQATITRPSETDVVVVILWSRLGVPLPVDQFPGRLSGGQVTGTEWEFEDALATYRSGGTPEILVYIKQARIPASFDDPDDPRLDALREDKRRLDSFLATWFWDKKKGEFRGAQRRFRDTSEFEEMLQRHLEAVLRKRIERGSRGGRRGGTWHRGSPFRGLEPFDVEHADVFFGRTRACNDLREALAAQAAKGSAFVAVIGASGSGKSSLVRAGLLPDLRLPGMVEGVGATRYAVVRPRGERSNPLAALSTALLAATALPELADSGYEPHSLHALLLKAPGQVVVPIGDALKRLREKEGLATHARALLVLVIDQFEELFAPSIDSGVREAFVGAVSALTRSGEVFVVVTLRSDFLEAFQDDPELVRLAQGAGTFILSPLTREELRQVIVRPALLAGLEYEVNLRTSLGLDEQLLRDAGEHAGTLPLLEYVLERLWHERTTEGQLTFEAYRRLGGLEGALSRRAEEVFIRLPQRVRRALPRVLRALVTVRPDERGTPTSRGASLSSFRAGTAERALVDALVGPEARLLVVDGEEVRIAHEALLAHWERAARQIDEDRRDLQTRARLEQQSGEWQSAPPGDRPGLLLPDGIRLSEASDLLRRRRNELSRDIRAFINASIEAHEDQQAVELEEERRRRTEAEYRQLRAELAERKAEAERAYSRAERNRALAARVASQDRRPNRERYAIELRGRAEEFDRQGDEIWETAYALERNLAHHPGMPAAEPPQQPPSNAIFSLEIPSHGPGDSFIVHYGEVAEPRLVLIDGGSGATYRRGLGARLTQLRDALSPSGSLSIELVVVTHYDEDHLGGIHRMLAESSALMHEGRSPTTLPKWVWCNNFVPAAIDPAAGREIARKDQIATLAMSLGVRANEPFDYFVMPSELGPACVHLDGGLEVTVLAPEAAWLRDWYTNWMRQQKRRGRYGADIVQQTGGWPAQAQFEEAVAALGEGFSSPRVDLLRAPPELVTIPPPARATTSAANLASIVTLLDFCGRRMLFTGDARCDHIIKGLSQAGLLKERHLHLDLMVVPHSGSLHNVSPEFFNAVTADHYVLVANTLYRLPDPKTLDMIAESRGKEPHTTHVVEPDRGDVLIDLLAPIGY